MVWPSGKVPDPAPVAGYTVRALPEALDSWWMDIHLAAIPTRTAAEFTTWLAGYRKLALPAGILVATDDATGKPVSTAGSILNSRDGVFPECGQLAWVATVPEHRRQGLGAWLSALATCRLREEGHRLIFLCTGDDLKPAIRVYLRLGYLPCLYAPDQPDRWARICEAIGHPFEPEAWPTPQAYLSA